MWPLSSPAECIQIYLESAKELAVIAFKRKFLSGFPVPPSPTKPRYNNQSVE